ncbi:hypothetical protein FOXG_14577 [Fusarium oxysporum f. sp. lycopersici 4287]|uniref:Uncharacterized protein n=2 Tax=Fusarium oxysporum TaxID=5507 RepID=A0A0J9VZ92_FUSO4|nr:hypothetical protein FOXG_14577 [Fusarium oxysporum f. sp. lycopersici 4287]KAJ9415094.1 hypothetical protein QL093DRAFT_2582854 [Fusarium oxysporum]KNB16111.1 hypothetical protein FOXG_14577 [Fusarium oxysporum f. sp. lycopersici 4287]
MRSSSQALLLGAMLQAVNAMDIARAAQRNHARDIPAPTITASPIGILDELKLLVGNDGLRIRQADSSSEPLKVTIAPDKTCGYLSGQPGAAVTCENDRLCSWAASSGVGLVACASEIYVACVESSKAVDPSQCNDVCQSNTFNLLCTNSDTPFCRTYAYPSGIFDYRCASTSVEDVQSVKFTYQGQKNANFVTTTLSDGIESQSTTVTNTDSGSAGQASETETQTETTTTSDVPEPTKKSKSTPVGAIVGGVVGGVALIGLIGLGAVCLLRRRKSKPEPASAPVQPVMAQQQPPPPPAPMNQNPYPQQQHYQPAVQPYPDHSMAASPAPSDARISMMSGPMSSVGPVSPGGWNQQPSPPPFHTPAPAYEMAGPEAREQEPVYEMGSDSVKK